MLFFLGTRVQNLWISVQHLVAPAHWLQRYANALFNFRQLGHNHILFGAFHFGPL